MFVRMKESASVRFSTVAVLAFIAMASPAAAQKKKNCPDPAPDSTAGDMLVYQRCAVDREAKPTGSRPPMDWSPSASGARNGSCFRADFRFVVDSVGFPVANSIRLVRTTQRDFADAVQASIQQMRYEPARLDGRAVPQLVEYGTMAGVRVTSSSSPSMSSRLPRC